MLLFFNIYQPKQRLKVTKVRHISQIRYTYADLQENALKGRRCIPFFTKTCRYWQLFVINTYAAHIKFLPMVAPFLVKHAEKMVSAENKSEENAIKTGYIAENIDIYSLFWQKLINFACVLL